MRRSGAVNRLRPGFPNRRRGRSFRRMRPLELTRSGIAGSVAVFVVAAICVRLGFWQLDRRQQRLDRNTAVAERMAEAPVALVGPPLDTAGLTYRRAELRGRYDNPRALVLAGRSLAGAPGVHILAPLRIPDGAVLVNRGWLPSRDAASANLRAVAVDTAVAISGVLLPLPRAEGVAPAEAFRTTWFRVDADAIRSQYPYPVSPLYLQALAPENETGARAAAAGAEGPVPLPPPLLDAGPHLSYALQWFSFALIFLVGWAALVMRGGRGSGERAGTTSAA
jgi:surfeit locus 1 family protein